MEQKLSKNERRRGWHALRRQQRRADAEKRQAAFNKLTPAQKLKKLEDAGHGHCREAQKYIAQMGEVPALKVPNEKAKSSRKMRKKDRKAAKK